MEKVSVEFDQSIVIYISLKREKNRSIDFQLLKQIYFICLNILFIYTISLWIARVRFDYSWDVIFDEGSDESQNQRKRISKPTP